ncbi:MAG TPA: hypothetical protein VHF26_02035 [Trebonia sp.]|nr:hypothetical protein [Trebonia sp.]
MTQPLPVTPTLTVAISPSSTVVPLMVKLGADLRSLIAFAAIWFAFSPARGSGWLAAGLVREEGPVLEVVPVPEAELPHPVAHRHSADMAVSPSTAFLVNGVNDRPVFVGVTIPR